METNKIVERQYTYIEKGKPHTVKRRYFVKHDREIKNSELDEYFKYHLDELQNKKNKLKDIVDEYNKNHLKISYAKFYMKYKEIFGYRKNHKHVEEDDNEDYLAMHPKRNKNNKLIEIDNVDDLDKINFYSDNEIEN